MDHKKLKTLAEIEKEHICLVLKETRGKQGRSAKILGICEKTLYRKRLLYGLPVRTQDISDKLTEMLK